MEDVRATPALREHRLYQADYLMRGYGFGADELVFDGGGNLPLALDPKGARGRSRIPSTFPWRSRTASRDAFAARARHRPGCGAAHRGRARPHHLRGLADLRRSAS